MALMKPSTAIIVALVMTTTVSSQSGIRQHRSARAYGVNCTLALYQYDEAASQPLEAEFRLPHTFDSAEGETTFLKRNYRLEDLLVRHIRSVGLMPGDRFRDAAQLGDTLLMIALQAVAVTDSLATLSIKITADQTNLLEKADLRLKNYETRAVRGGRARFGALVFEGPQGKEQATVDRTLLLTVTAVIVPEHQLQNRPTDVAFPTDEYGTRLELKDEDEFLPPVIIERVAPRGQIKRQRAASILVEALVTPTGKFTNIRVLRTFDSELNERAIEAVSQYKALPARLNGQPVYAILREEVSFLPAPPTSAMPTQRP